MDGGERGREIEEKSVKERKVAIQINGETKMEKTSQAYF